MELQKRNNLEEKRRQIYKLLGRAESEAILKEIKEILKSKDLKYNPDPRLVEVILKLSEQLKNLPEIPKKIESPIVNIHNPDKIKINWKDAPEDLKPKDKVKINWEDMPSKDCQLVEVEGLDESLKKIIPDKTQSDLPENVTMELDNKDLWKKVSINYPKETITISIDRNTKDVIQKLIFAKE